MSEPIPLRVRPIRPERVQAASATPGRGLGQARALGSARPAAYRQPPVPPLRWHARWPRPHPIAWAVFGCVIFWWEVICALRF
jgi:hypothetical protein